MPKTELTIQLEKALAKQTKQKRIFGCFEVTIGWYGRERVDYLTLDYKNMWRCKFSGSAHPNRRKRRTVVFDHLYLFTREQVDHLIKLQKYWQTSYGDEERTRILKEIERTTT